MSISGSMPFSEPFASPLSDEASVSNDHSPITAGDVTTAGAGFGLQSPPPIPAAAGNSNSNTAHDNPLKETVQQAEVEMAINQSSVVMEMESTRTGVLLEQSALAAAETEVHTRNETSMQMGASLQTPLAVAESGIQEQSSMATLGCKVPSPPRLSNNDNAATPTTGILYGRGRKQPDTSQADVETAKNQSRVMEMDSTRTGVLLEQSSIAAAETEVHKRNDVSMHMGASTDAPLVAEKQLRVGSGGGRRGGKPNRLTEVQVSPNKNHIAADNSSEAPLDVEEADEETLGESFGNVHDGMRREWNFSLSFVHEAARVSIQMSPQWEPTFMDSEDMQQLHRLDRDVKHCPLTSVLSYTDLSAVLVGGGPDPAAAAKPHQTGSIGSDGTSEAPSPAAGATSGDMWLEKSKNVQLLYSHIPPEMTLSMFCVVCVQHVLKDPDVVSVDGDTALGKLRVGNKLACPYRLGGTHRSFHFNFHLKNKSKLMNDSAYAIGTIINQRGYLLIARCIDEQELEGYVQRLFLPHYTNATKMRLDEDIEYRDISSIMLSDQQETYGELLYEDRDAAISFSLPMYPMRIRPDFTPAKTVGVGSIACMTLEINAHERLFDDASVAEVTGMPKYKISPIVLCVDVEDVARMGYPKILSTDQYSELKMKRVLEVFPDAKLIGQPTTISLGGRPGRSYTATFAYEPMRCVVKAMVVSTLIGSRGATALYLARLGGGGFDTHLYLYQQLLSSVRYHEQNAQKLGFDRRHVPNVRLMDTDLLHVYGSTPADRLELEVHRRLLKESNDGKAEGATHLQVPVEEGGLVPRYQHHHRSTIAESVMDDDHLSVAASSYRRSIYQSVCTTRSGDEFGGGEDIMMIDGEGVAWEETSMHSQSLISVSGIPRLHHSPDSDEEDSEPRNAAAADAAQQRTEESQAAVSIIMTSRRSSQRGNGKDGSPMRNQSFCSSAGGSIAAEPRQAFAAADESAAQLSAADDASAHAASPNSQHLSPSAYQPLDVVVPMHEDDSYKLAVKSALDADDSAAYLGPSLRDVYTRCCDLQHCRPNSYLLKKLPTDPRFTGNVEEVDLTANYLGRNGFVAVLSLLEHLTCLRRVYFNNMALDNVDAENLCETLAKLPTLDSVAVEHNPKITLPATKFFTRMLNVNPSITKLSLVGTRLGESVMKRLALQAEQNPGVAIE